MGLVKVGQCSRSKGPGKGLESGGRTYSPFGRGARGAAATSEQLHPPWPMALSGDKWPGILAHQPYNKCRSKTETEVNQGVEKGMNQKP